MIANIPIPLIVRIPIPSEWSLNQAGGLMSISFLGVAVGVSVAVRVGVGVIGVGVRVGVRVGGRGVFVMVGETVGVKAARTMTFAPI